MATFVEFFSVWNSSFTVLTLLFCSEILEYFEALVRLELFIICLDILLIFGFVFMSLAIATFASVCFEI